MILRFKQTMFLQAPDGSYTDERTCLEYPRIRQLQQCARGGNTVTTFIVDGVRQPVGSLLEALGVLRDNPRPDDILSVPPISFTQVPNEAIRGHSPY